MLPLPLSGALDGRRVSQLCECWSVLFVPSLQSLRFTSFFLGVLGPVPGLIGTLQAVETIKLITSRHRLTEGEGRGGSAVSLLIGRQIYYDGAAGEFHSFSLPPRRRACLSCGDTRTAETASLALAVDPSMSAPLALPPLAADHRISTSQYLTVLQAGSSHVLLDVRSRLQYEMISLPLDKYAPPSLSGTTFICLNLPYSTLSPSLQTREGGDSASTTLLNAAQTGECLLSLPVTLSPPAVSSDESGENALPVFVLCRRGNDSVRATAALLARYPKMKIFNIDGGLSSWSAEIDPSFPLY
jgi:adenylyltransferase and sulfurtransferase